MSMAAAGCAMLVAGSTMIATASANSSVDHVAVVNQTGKRALVRGTLPKCRTGAVRTLEVRLTQSGKTARGIWRGRCRGAKQAWRVVLRTNRGQLTPGSARLEVRVGYRFGKQRVNHRISGRVRLRTKAGELPADRQIMVGVTFDLPVGYEVYVEGGGDGPKRSRCTRDETVERFTSDGSPKRVLFQFVAKDGGGCSVDASYNQVWVAVDGPGRDERGGYFWLGQKDAGHPYFASCKVRVENVYDSYDWINAWNGLACTQPGDWELKVSLP